MTLQRNRYRCRECKAWQAPGDAEVCCGRHRVTRLLAQKVWQIGTGMVESTAKQLVGMRLKGPGMHWSRHGATAITALRAQDLNEDWHKFWKNLALAS